MLVGDTVEPVQCPDPSLLLETRIKASDCVFTPVAKTDEAASSHRKFNEDHLRSTCPFEWMDEDWAGQVPDPPASWSGHCDVRRLLTFFIC